MTDRDMHKPVEETKAEDASTPTADHAQSPETGAAEPATFSGQPDDLHNLFAATPNFTGTDEEDPLAQLRTDPNYSALIRDLEYIASQARLLFAPAEEAPSEEVWKNIERKLGTPPTEA